MGTGGGGNAGHARRVAAARVCGERAIRGADRGGAGHPSARGRGEECGDDHL